jgi:hypothetical protein
VERAQVAQGSYLDDAASPVVAVLTIGFVPRYVEVENDTDRILLQWREGMTADYAIQTAAVGTRTLETSGGITVSGRTISFAPAQSKQYRWRAVS